jgi:hypothetical protein
MDPDACLELIHGSLAELREILGEPDADSESVEYARDDVVESLRNLADWIVKGGFPPKGVWERTDR